MKKIIDTVDIELLKELYLVKNYTTSEVATTLGVSLSTINRIIKKFNIRKDKKLIYKKIEENNLAKFGYKNISQVPSFKEKIKNTCLLKYGVDNNAKSIQSKEKAKKTNQEKYGVNWTGQVKEAQQKKKETCLKKYGTEFASQNIEVRNKISYSNNLVDKQAKYEKYKQTMLLNYGVENYFQAKEFKNKAWKRYNYNNISFDSSWELALYIYARDHNEEIIREPITFSFMVKDKLHYYTPDFLYKGQLIEIKGDHLLKNNKIIDPYNHCTTEYLSAKNRCLQDNNIKIISKNEIDQILKYINIKYGVNFLKQFKNKV